MRRSLSHLLLAGAVSASLASCVTTPTEEDEQHRYGHGSSRQDTEVVTETTVSPDGANPTPTPAVINVEPSITPVPSPTPMAAPVAADYPVATPVDGKPGYVNSPYSASGIVDVRGYPPGTEVRDPYSNKIFLVP